MSRGPSSDEALALVLAIVPWLAERGRTSLDEIGAAFGLPERDVMAVLSAVQCCEIPPYGGATIGIVVGDDGVVEVEPLVAFDRPLALTAQEAFGLLAAGRAALAARPDAHADGALERGLEVLEGHLGVRAPDVELTEPEHVDTLRRAVAEARTVRLEHVSPTRGHVERDVDPWRVDVVDGLWYLVAHCHLADGVRTFRIDRLWEVTPTGVTFEAPSDPPAPRLAPDSPELVVRLRVPVERAWALDEATLTERSEGDGVVEAEVPVWDAAFLDRLLLRIGPGVEVLEPAGERDRPKRAAAAVLARYGV